MWDFNAIRSRGQRSGPSCDIQISKHFNAFMNRLNLVNMNLLIENIHSPMGGNKD